MTHYNGVTFDSIDVKYDPMNTPDTFAAQFNDGSSPDTISDVYVRGNRDSGLVWYDSYRTDPDGDTQTVWGSLNPDIAEQIGLALITAARIARGVDTL